ncbi:ORF4-like protein [Pseudomonas coronafaciens pv. porri]|nr:ORF4-like protein [Pseudomonas coronafaciens pv. porri]
MDQFLEAGMQTYIPYPKNPPTVGTVLLTSYGSFAHENEIPKSCAADALRVGKELADGFDGEVHHLGALMLMISDFPAEPLLKASAAKKGSLLGITSLGYLLSYGSTGEKAKRIIEAGCGIFLVRVSGDIENPKAKIEVYSSWSEYQKFLEPILKTGDFYPVKTSSFSE